MIVKEFPDVAKLTSIGQTWQERKLKVLELDARKLMGERGVKPIEGPTAAEKKKQSCSTSPSTGRCPKEN